MKPTTIIKNIPDANAHQKSSEFIPIISSGDLGTTLSSRRPWNRVNLPVYSISSKGENNANMHIITYASQISMKPKRFICGIYDGTRTLENTTQGRIYFTIIISYTIPPGRFVRKEKR